MKRISGAAAKKRKKIPEAARRINAVRRLWGLTQKKFGEALNVSQATVSAWESGEDKPSSESWLKLALMVTGRDRDWLVGKAGRDAAGMMQAAEILLQARKGPPAEGEIVRVPCFRKTGREKEETASLLTLPAEVVSNPGSTSCLLIDKATPTKMFSPGDIVILDTSESSAKDLTQFWDQIVLLDITDQPRRLDPNFTWGVWPIGLSMGRLRCKQLGDYATWVATLGPFGDAKTSWEPGDEGFCVGGWSPDAPVLEISRRISRHHGVPEECIPRGEKWGITEAEAEKRARANMRLEDACRILGRVIGWFAAQQVLVGEK